MQETAHNQTDYRRQLRNRILDVAMQAFSAQGVKAVRMDDIANTLSISKRTLYEIYANKEDLLFEGMKVYQQRRRDAMEAFIRNDEHNVMDIILFSYGQTAHESQSTCVAFFDDLARYPKVMAYLEDMRRQSQSQVQEFLARGVREGFFRADVNYELIGHIFEAIGEYMQRRHLYQQYSFDEIFINMLFVALRGFCTQKGVQVLDEFLSRKK